MDKIMLFLNFYATYFYVIFTVCVIMTCTICNDKIRFFSRPNVSPKGISENLRPDFCLVSKKVTDQELYTYRKHC